MKKQRKKRRTGLLVFLLIAVLAFGGISAFYFMQRQKPVSAVKAYLGYAKEMNFDGMSALLQDSDLSLLDAASLRDEALASFFRGTAQKIQYEIKKTHFHFQNGTANVTVSLRYIDGADIYKEASSEFVQQMLTESISGEEGGSQDSHQRLASLLDEKSQTVADNYTETEISYPLVKTADGWKITALDGETVNVLSANFQSVAAELASLETMNTEESSPAEVPAASEDSTIDMSNEQFSIRYTQHRTATDVAGNPCLLVYYDYTNNGTAASSAMVHVSLQAYQNGALCETALPAEDDAAIDQYMEDVQPGQTVNVCQAFSLTNQADVTLQAGEALSFGGGDTATQILKIQ